jgi:formate hydrogenlyase transcriptional activator
MIIPFERLSPNSNNITTNQPLDANFEGGRAPQDPIRQDLYYRLHVFSITVPPLRHRKEDIPLLVQAIIERYAGNLGKQITSIQKETMKALQDYPWPGNVRELESVLERAVILCPGPALQLADKLEISSLPLSSAVRTLEMTERNQILKVLSETRWRIEGKDGATKMPGLHPSTLRARMHKPRDTPAGDQGVRLSWLVLLKGPLNILRFHQRLRAKESLQTPPLFSSINLSLRY